MTAKARAIALIQPFEACQLRAYRCPAGVWTCGWGSTGPDVGPHTVWTQDQADNRLLRDVARFERDILALVTVPLSEHQLAALISFVYNIGLNAFAHSTFLKLLNAGDYAGASAQFPRWAHAAGQVLNGLVRRRAAERACFDGP